MMDPRFLGESGDRKDPEGRLGATRGGKGTAFNPAARDEVINIMKGGSAGCQISGFQLLPGTTCPDQGYQRVSTISIAFGKSEYHVYVGNSC